MIEETDEQLAEFAEKINKAEARIAYYKRKIERLNQRKNRLQEILSGIYPE